MSAKVKSAHKARKIVVIVLASLIALVLLVLLGARAWFRLPVREYYSHSEKAFKIPGVNDGMILQGLAYDETNEWFYVTGYRTDGAASQVGIVSDGRTLKCIDLADPDGKPYTGHVGGITVAGKFVYVADEDGLIVYATEDFAAANDGESVRALGYFSTLTEEDELGVAFVHAEGDRLYVGEFFREENYQTPASHKYTTAAGDDNTALLLEYRLDETAEFGIADEIEAAYSIPSLVQGMCFDDAGHICLSTSYGPAFSHIYIYDAPAQEGEITVLGQNVALYALDSSNLVVDMKLAPMSEEIVALDGKLYVMCESASNKYIFGKFTSAQYCYATDLGAYLN